jgi:two-component system sensor histidine kinase GlrK
LQKLIEDLLSFGANQAHRPEVELERVELKRVVNRVIEDQKLALRGKRLQLDVEVQDLTLNADSEKIRVMLDNLVSNAIKFSPAGGTIRIAAEKDWEQVQLDVSDNGPGIAPEERSLVFEPFFRGRHAADALVKGTGIGLSVVRDYAHVHGGTAEVLDRTGGAHIRLRLPLVRARATALDETRSAAESLR